MDAVGVMIALVQEAWGRGCIVGALLMDVAAAFPSVARGCLLKKMKKAGVFGLMYGLIYDGQTGHHEL